MLIHERVAENFGLMWRAQENRDAELLVPFVSDGYLEQSRAAFDELDRQARTHQIEDDRLRDVAVVRPDADAAGDTARAYLAFAVRHSIVDLRTGAVVGGDAVTTRAWTARWTFTFEPRRGWLVDRLEAVWRSRDGQMPAAGEWPGLPAGWYSLRERPSEWTYWDGDAWRRDP
ncbi:MAG: hypothetical protein QOC77_801 [Thermoleophilaceae bacterium]|jgi:predicted lipid-binding transport protein (Tim44 family)|nr:hypothetical protein [Thermoleophilaceae bacterium]MEA2471586.1 hypothetical protein [Thermoleophilaceae bacterium]